MLWKFDDDKVWFLCTYWTDIHSTKLKFWIFFIWINYVSLHSGTLETRDPQHYIFVCSQSGPPRHNPGLCSQKIYSSDDTGLSPIRYNSVEMIIKATKVTGIIYWPHLRRTHWKFLYMIRHFKNVLFVFITFTDWLWQVRLDRLQHSEKEKVFIHDKWFMQSAFHFQGQLNILSCDWSPLPGAH